MQKFDIVVVGAGSGGLTTAVGLSKVGKKVILVEREHMGGECTNNGCIPSKALLHYAKEYHQAVTIAGVNGNTENYRREALNYVRSKIAGLLKNETPAHFEKLGITVVMDEAKFSSRTTITIGEELYQFKQAVIATGSSPRTIKVTGLDDNDILTNQNLFTISDIPKRTLIIGGGPIGMEMGQALAMLGSKVTIADNGERFAKHEDGAISPIITNAFTDLDIQILLGASLNHCENKVAVIDYNATSDNTQSQTVRIPYDKVLVAIGRVPNIPNGLNEAGITFSEYGVTVNKQYQTSNKNIYALGDVADRFKFTHQADDIARQVVTRIVSLGLISVKEKSIPKVTYTNPEMAQVGLSWPHAQDKFGSNNLHRIEVPFGTNDRAYTDDTTDGILVVIAKRMSGKIIGAHIIGPRAGEIIASFTIAIDNNLSLWKLRRTIYAYPTYSQVIKKAGDYFFAIQIKTLRSDIFSIAKKILPKLLLVTLWISGLIYLSNYQIHSGRSLTDTILEIFTFISKNPIAPLLYILAYAVRPITFIPGTILTVSSGIFFGFWPGVLYTIIGANLSATVAYFIGRYFGKNIRLENSIFGRFIKTSQEKPFVAILLTRLLFLPFDTINYGAGVLQIPFIPYIVATCVGTILGIATFVAAGSSLSIKELQDNGLSTNLIDGKFLLLSTIIFVISISISKLIKK